MIDFIAVGGYIYVSVVRPVGGYHILSPDDEVLDIPFIVVLDVRAHIGRIDHVVQEFGIPGDE